MGNANTSSRQRTARIEITSPQPDEEGSGSRVKFSGDKRNIQTYTITPKMAKGELHPDDVMPRVVRGRTKPPAGLEESEAKEESSKYIAPSEPTIIPHPKMDDEYSGDTIPPKTKTFKKVNEI